MIKALKNTLTFDLYKNNQDRFHQWLSNKKYDMMSSMWFPIVTIVGGVMLAVFLFAIYDGRQEIDTSDYKRLLNNEASYSQWIPEYGPMLQKAMYDGVITNGELWELQSLKIDYRAREKAKKHLKAKNDLIKQLK